MTRYYNEQYPNKKIPDPNKVGIWDFYIGISLKLTFNLLQRSLNTFY
ncbi:hypothetical protein RC62_4522 [Flavobacterium aquidurense]|uniref:Uncharacterized protein n=1 Tax=Flavobacterium aquidurense TaxID=362413 RepID=A0A0Q1BK30_9FLAO|nr:hypothetical protein RC62_4522 [Flavobacterium aquidurense]